MFSLHCNSPVKSWRNKKRFAKNNKNQQFINKYNWEGINFPSQKDDWKKNEKNNVTIALNVLYVKKEKIYPGYVLKHNSNHEKQVIVLTIPNGKKWQYLAVEKEIIWAYLKKLLRGITLVIFIVWIVFITLEHTWIPLSMLK